ncbi:hypothetical protein D7X96_08825 [Corallococcus interemptor]|uniref:Lanthionine biosynthesis cyclase LanC n=1 Tax=Corallococcus interemptor TaxID=2316720 RepID=A0A3A8QU08_9BACT|nr:hypothetical protein D7X96_08825 [Corallococcus interemptor]
MRGFRAAPPRAQARGLHRGATSLSNTWKPVLSGPTRARALEAAEAIVQDMAGAPLVRRPPDLAKGHAGLALFFEAAGRALDTDHLDRVGEHLRRSAEGFLRAGQTKVGLHGGLAGLGWVAAHLSARHPDLDVEEVCGPVDEAIARELELRPWPHPCDLRAGLGGMGLYALTRLHHPSTPGLLERMVTVLEETAEPTAQGLRWPLPPNSVRLYGDPQAFPRGVYTLGVAHGMPGGLALLGALHAHGIARERVGALLEGGFAWMASLVGSGEHPGFPHYLHGDTPVVDARFSWCVGTPGITAVLWWAARAWGHAGWQDRALAWAEAVAREGLERPPFVPRRSANLCCGTAGTALLFLRLFHATGRPIFEEAAVRWFEHTLSLRQPGQGPGGYCFEQKPDRPDDNLQFGAAGIALALLAGATGHEPDWDECLLMSLRPRPLAKTEA